MTSTDTSTAAFAFFDVDDTLIATKSMFSFQDYWYRRHNEPDKRQAFEMEMQRLRDQDAPWESLNSRYYAHFAGRSAALVTKLGTEWFETMERTHPEFYHTKVVERLRQLQAEGVEPVFVSGSFPALLAPLARRLKVQHLLCCRLEETGGVLTGRLIPPQTIGAGKALAMRAFMAAHKARPQDCYAFGDDITDRPMLEAVGYPVAVAGGRGLESHAANAGWPILPPR
ncbi:MAG TPA: HAD-IB family hydrolase [Candidatus Sulfotelmatobacter sp.]|jgi:HAD superfamily hydrolase (TIGR01490 family)|nr:HAD-IB family hydrolase [Candidatus Sulfotelmatobacter sp.]